MFVLPLYVASEDFKQTFKDEDTPPNNGPVVVILSGSLVRGHAKTSSLPRVFLNIPTKAFFCEGSAIADNDVIFSTLLVNANASVRLNEAKAVIIMVR